MTKLPSLSVLLAPQGHFSFQTAPCNNNSYAVPQHRPEVLLPLHYYAHPEHQQQQPQHYQQQQPQHYQQQQPSYKYASAPGSPSSPSCWEPTLSSTSCQPPSPPPYYNSQYQQQQPAAMAYHSEYFSSSSEDESSVQSMSSASANDVLQASSAATKATSSSSVRPKKTSRYLREMDRRAIIKRLDDGEKQCALAKEFNVSRSSICNLFKHREEVLLRAHHQSPFSKHPKKKCNKRRQSQMLLHQHSLHHAGMVPTHSTSGMRV